MSGIIKGPMDSPVMADFAANLDRINALAERSPGLCVAAPDRRWQCHGAIRPFEDANMLVNMSVWRDVASLNEVRLSYRPTWKSAPPPGVVRTNARELFSSCGGCQRAIGQTSTRSHRQA